MNVEIINIGDELLIGQVVNTNASWMAEKLNLAGFWVHRISVISDVREEILTALSEAENRSSVILISGGIGPTNDDITKQALCEYFNTRLVFDEAAYKDIESLFLKRGWSLPVSELNRLQAFLPERCISFPNELGTARGMWFEKEKAGGGTTVFVSLPGVPFEMKALMTNHVIPALKEKFRTPFIVHRTILTQGIGESMLAEKIAAWESRLPENIRLAYLPQPGIVRLRLTGTGSDEASLRRQIENESAQLEKLIPDLIFGYDEETLEEVIGRLLTERKATVATAESCTGGYIAHLITSIPGSSGWYKGSVVAYANEIKEHFLEIDPGVLQACGAVSREVVTGMAQALQARFEADYVIATSGIAGPDGGTPDKPVGTVWIAIASPGDVTAYHYMFGNDRERNIRRSALQALNLLRKKILQ